MSRKKPKNKKELVVAGGGTGGHFFCGLAIAEKYLAAYPQHQVLFVGVRRGIEGRYRLEDSRMSVSFVPASGFKKMNIFQKFEAFMNLITGFFVSASILFKARPKYVVGVGGYSSFPLMLAAWVFQKFLGCSVSVVDQNSVPGLVNKVLSKLGVRAFCPFPVQGFRSMKLPVLNKIEEAAKVSRTPNWPPETILVLGGSQGAQGLNSAWINMIPKLHERFPNAKFIHQTGPQGLEFVRAAYNDLQMKADCFAFSNDLAQYMNAADLVVSRAGALSVFELLEFKRPVIFVPFPHASDDHQFKNALAVHARSWVVAEHDFRWENVDPLLKESSPPLPQIRKPPQYSWRAVLH